MNVKLFNMINGNRFYPSKTYLNDAGYDLYLPRDIYLEPNKSNKYKLDISINWTFEMNNLAVLSFPRSSSSLDGKVYFTTGVIDSGYEGSLYLVAHNTTDEIVHLKKGDRVVQLLFVRLYEHVDMSNILKDGVRGKAGFGSSGK